jgi:hypothetical protein
MADLPTVLTAAGLQPQLPATLRALLLARVAATNPGYTANLPGSLIEDVASTDVGALALIDQARVEVVNSLTPFGANAFLLNQLGQMLGIPLGLSSNTSVFVTFTGPEGFAIAKGFTVSDGNFQYVVQDGGLIGEDGNSPQLFALATQSGTWVVPAGTVVQLVTSVPPPVVLTVTNLEAGIPGADAETETSYRARVLQGNLAASQGMSRYLKTFLGKVEGVQQRLIAAQQQEGGGWMIIVGGGDPYAVANAIWTSLFDISTLVGSVLLVADITTALPAVVESFLNHGFVVGEDVTLSDVNPSDYDGDYIIWSVPDEKHFGLAKPFAAQDIDDATWSGGEVTLEFLLNHDVTTGATIVVTGNLPVEYNGTFVVTDTPSATTLTYALVSDPGMNTQLGQMAAGFAPFDGTGLTWVSGGVITPNNRNIEVTITDYPDTYLIPFVNPPQQDVTMTVTWNTTSTNFVAPASVAQLAAPALVDYVNSVAVGQPLNVLEMEAAFQAAVISVLPLGMLTRLLFAVSINGIGTSPESGTKIIEGDPESFFFSEVDGINVVQG